MKVAETEIEENFFNWFRTDIEEKKWGKKEEGKREKIHSQV